MLSPILLPRLTTLVFKMVSLQVLLLSLMQIFFFLICTLFFFFLFSFFFCLFCFPTKSLAKKNKTKTKNLLKIRWLMLALLLSLLIRDSSNISIYEVSFVSLVVHKLKPYLILINGSGIVIKVHSSLLISLLLGVFFVFFFFFFVNLQLIIDVVPLL